MLENKFKTKLIKDIKKMFPDCMVLHTDANECQGIPDIIILNDKNWAALEGKKSADAPAQPNQPYYVDKMNNMSFARFIYPENKEEVLSDLSESFGIKKPTRISRSK